MHDLLPHAFKGLVMLSVLHLVAAVVAFPPQGEDLTPPYIPIPDTIPNANTPPGPAPIESPTPIIWASLAPTPSKTPSGLPGTANSFVGLGASMEPEDDKLSGSVAPSPFLWGPLPEPAFTYSGSPTPAPPQPDGNKPGPPHSGGNEATPPHEGADKIEGAGSAATTTTCAIIVVIVGLFVLFAVIAIFMAALMALSASRSGPLYSKTAMLSPRAPRVSAESVVDAADLERGRANEGIPTMLSLQPNGIESLCDYGVGDFTTFTIPDQTSSPQDYVIGSGSMMTKADFADLHADLRDDVDTSGALGLELATDGARTDTAMTHSREVVATGTAAAWPIIAFEPNVEHWDISSRHMVHLIHESNWKGRISAMFRKGAESLFPRRQ